MNGFVHGKLFWNKIGEGDSYQKFTITNPFLQLGSWEYIGPIVLITFITYYHKIAVRGSDFNEGMI